MDSIPIPQQPVTPATPQSNLNIKEYAGVKTNTPNGDILGQGALANNFDQTSSAAGVVNVVNDYPWTQTKVKGRNDIPYIKLIEHRNEQSLLMRQFSYYAQGVVQTVDDALISRSAKGLLNVYDEIWPDNPTNWSYWFPYFSKTQYELNTPNWSKVDSPGEQIKGAAGGVADALKKVGFEKAAGFLNGAVAVGEAVAAGAELALKGVSPLVGVVDRPRIFTEHSERSINIQFPLYNTINKDDWKKNRDFYYRFASQNLFNKRDFITGLPPVWYRVYIPGQYYSHASCVTNFTVENLGNSRLAYGDFIVPDAYQITITLTEMLMPSLNQFQSVISGDAKNRVNAS